jgi:hypothetical protein
VVSQRHRAVPEGTTTLGPLAVLLNRNYTSKWPYHAHVHRSRSCQPPLNSKICSDHAQETYAEHANFFARVTQAKNHDCAYIWRTQVDRLKPADGAYTLVYCHSGSMHHHQQSKEHSTIPAWTLQDKKFQKTRASLITDRTHLTRRPTNPQADQSDHPPAHCPSARRPEHSPASAARHPPDTKSLAAPDRPIAGPSDHPPVRPLAHRCTCPSVCRSACAPK